MLQPERNELSSEQYLLDTRQILECRFWTNLEPKGKKQSQLDRFSNLNPQLISRLNQKISQTIDANQKVVFRQDKNPAYIIDPELRLATAIHSSWCLPKNSINLPGKPNLSITVESENLCFFNISTDAKNSEVLQLSFDKNNQDNTPLIYSADSANRLTLILARNPYSAGILVAK